MGWSKEKWILNYINSKRKNGEEITLQNAKESTISAEERLHMEQNWGEEKIAEIFGEVSHLQKAEMMILQIEKGQLTKEEKYSNIIAIAYAITNVCGKLDSSHSLWDKYCDLSSYIPIEIMERKDKDIWYFFLTDLDGQRICIAADELEKMKTWLFSSEEAKENLPKKAFFEYIFELVYISLKEIFKEVKAEIMGE